MAQLPLLPEDFEGWLRPADARATLEKLWGQDIATDAIAGRLRTGIIQAYAGTRVREIGYSSSRHTEISALEPIPAKHWVAWPSRADPTFWKVGDVTLYDAAGSRYATYHDVRFHPRDIQALIPPKPAPPQGTSPPEPLEPPIELKPPPRPEAEKFARAILHSWPDCTQDWAYEKAVAFFPKNKVPRDWFRSILRSIRGPQKPGKKPVAGD